MKERRDGDKTTFDDAPGVIPAVFGAAALFVLGQFILVLFGMIETEHPVWTMPLIATISLGFALFFFRRDSNTFDGAARCLTWSKWSPLGRTGGTVAYDDIQNVTVETMSGMDSTSTARVVIHTVADKIPLTVHYSASLDSWEPVATRIRQLVGLNTADLTDDSLRALVAEGRKIDAIRQLREKSGMSLADAKPAVEGLGETARSSRFRSGLDLSDSDRPLKLAHCPLFHTAGTHNSASSPT